MVQRPIEYIEMRVRQYKSDPFVLSCHNIIEMLIGKSKPYFNTQTGQLAYSPEDLVKIKTWTEAINEYTKINYPELITATNIQ